MIPVRDAHDRRSVRHNARTDCQVVAEEGFRLLGVRTLDLSDEGMLLRSGASVKLGERCLVAVRVPNTNRWIDAEAEVVRIVRGRRTTDDARGIGLRFTRMDEADRALLAGSLVRMPPPVPARHVRKDYADAIQKIGLGLDVPRPGEVPMPSAPLAC